MLFLLLLLRLASIERFSRFSRQLEVSVNALETSYLHLSGTHADMLNSLNMLGRDMQRFARGQQPTTAGQGSKVNGVGVREGGGGR